MHRQVGALTIGVTKSVMPEDLNRASMFERQWIPNYFNLPRKGLFCVIRFNSSSDKLAEVLRIVDAGGTG